MATASDWSHLSFLPNCCRYSCCGHLHSANATDGYVTVSWVFPSLIMKKRKRTYLRKMQHCSKIDNHQVSVYHHIWLARDQTIKSSSTLVVLHLILLVCNELTTMHVLYWGEEGKNVHEFDNIPLVWCFEPQCVHNRHKEDATLAA